MLFPHQPEAHEEDDSDVTSIPYMDGFVDGFTAARDYLLAKSQPDESFPWFSQVGRLQLPYGRTLTSSVAAQEEAQNFSPSYPLDFSALSGHDYPQQAFSTGNAGSSAGQCSSPGDSRPTNSWEARPVLDRITHSWLAPSPSDSSNLSYLVPVSDDCGSPLSSLTQPGLVRFQQHKWSDIISCNPITLHEQPENATHVISLSNEGERATPRCLTPPKAHNLLTQVKVNSGVSAVVSKRGPPEATQLVFRAYGTKRSRLNERSRVSTARTRELGACEACRKKKLRCEQAMEDFAPCGRCATTPLHLLYRPCCRVEIIDIKLFRFGAGSDHISILHHRMQSKAPSRGQLLLQDGTIVNELPRKVQVTHDVCTTTFEITISRYQPGPEDATGYSWTDGSGTRQTYELPPYYISDIAKSDLIAGALIFWSATRMIERFWMITGDDLLGLPPMEQSIGPCRYNPRIKAIPVTPIMDTQLDEIAIKHVLIPLKSKVLSLLKEKVLEKNKKNWYEIFLATFIILHNSEVVLGQVMDYSRRYGLGFTNRPNDESSLSHAYYHACKTVLAYFHFASGGAAPISFNWLNPHLDSSAMSPKQIEFLRDLKSELQTQGKSTINCYIHCDWCT
ncbi:hypothetical protein RRF57_007876 [Xylaria bambusicola]|uniref:Zn(2)-C6 fungal-type domain-containing protein n=1 Tax=Xylaria bambusicola TaxID=326684 RepID=A0AAN7Z6M3_9PEZI